MKKIFKFSEDADIIKKSFEVMKDWKDGMDISQSIKMLCKINKQDLISEKQFIDMCSFWGYTRND